MLAYLNILIGLSVIMLGFSLIVTVVNQTIANVLATRGKNLSWGLSVLIQELHSEHFTPHTGGIAFCGKELNASANELVGKILSHRLLSDSKVPLGAWKLATAIRFDELLKTIDLIGASGGGDAAWLRQNNRITETWFN